MEGNLVPRWPLPSIFIVERLHQEFLTIEIGVREAFNRPLSYTAWRKEIDPIRDRVKWFEGLKNDIRSLVRMVDLFDKELRAAGRDPQEMKSRLGMLLVRNAEIETRIEAVGEGRIPQFADVPKGHWVYDALEDGRNRQHFFGYPDDLLRGGSFATRYELASVVNALYQDLRGQIIGQLDRVTYGPPGGPGPESPSELTRAIAATNWVLRHRRQLRNFHRFPPS